MVVAIKVVRREKPGKVDVAEELGFKQSRLPEIGPGSHKPKMGRGGVPIPDNYYGESDLKIPEKKGIGTGEKVKHEKAEKEKKDSNKTSWTDVI